MHGEVLAGSKASSLSLIVATSRNRDGEKMAVIEWSLGQVV